MYKVMIGKERTEPNTSVKNIVFWEMTPCRYLLPFQRNMQPPSILKMEAACSSKSHPRRQYSS
jgi:hypothetical protein